MAGNCKREVAGFTGLQGKQTAEGMITFDDNPMTGIVGRKYDPVWGSMRAERSLLSILGADKAKMYTRLALMGVAQQAGDYTVDDLIQMVGIGLRDLTPDEFQRVVTHVANAGFDPDRLERAGSRIAGLLWNGKVVKGGDLLPPGEVHYLRHVVAGREWPEGTSINDYYASLSPQSLTQLQKLSSADMEISGRLVFGVWTELGLNTVYNIDIGAPVFVRHRWKRLSIVSTGNL